MGFLVVKETVLEGETVMCSSDISYNDDHNHNNYDNLKLTLMFSHLYRPTHTNTHTHTHMHIQHRSLIHTSWIECGIHHGKS